MAAPALRFMETQARVYRRTWKASAFTTFLNPVLFLLAMGMGLGTLVDRGDGAAGLGGLTYLQFLAPGLLAASAMQTAAGDSSFPVMAGVKWQKTYHAALATPISARDLVHGHLIWVLVRLLMTVTAFFVVMALFGAARLPGGAVAVLPAVLTGMAFAAPVTAFAVRLENDYHLSSLFRFGIVPLFLFSGTFFPISQLPGWLQPAAYVTPLWHGVELTRAAALGTAPAWPPILHAAYLAAWVAVGVGLAVRGFRRRLVR
ncbi:MAG: ABC transporter permease [Euzebyales bacterium]|nr:ABC transporter permease [Euzebyales bacterium]MBA3620753.1 ABC transporter permease [Euzebyales bacterium]